MSAPEPGWYDDPTHPGRLRWWDGERWTPNTRDLPDAASGSVASEPRVAATASSWEPDPNPDPNPDPEPEPQPDPSPTPAPQPQPAPQPVIPPLPQPPSWGASGVEVGEAHRGQHVPGLPPPPPNLPTASRRRGLVAGAIALVVVGAGIAAGIAVPDEGSVFDLARGDCLDEGDSFADEAEAIATVPVADCNGPHDAEVYAVFDLDGTRYPGDEATGEQALSGCLDRFEDEVGLPLHLTSLDVTTLRPTSESWDEGDRGVVCILKSFSSGPLTGTSLGRGVDWSMQVGECFDAPLLGAGGELAPSFERRPCDVDHTAEVFLSDQLPEGPHPGSTALQEIVEGLCFDRFASYVGQPWEDSSLEFGFITPSLGRWAGGDRGAVCYVFDPRGPMIGAAANWAMTSTPVSGGFGAYDVSQLDVGDCFDDPFGEAFEGPVTSVPCGRPHHNETFLVFDLEEARLPDDLEAMAIERCDTPFHDYVGANRETVVWFWLGPDAASWEAGDRRVVCALYAKDFSNLTGSMRAGPV